MNVEMKLNVKVDTYVNGNLIVQDVSSVVDDKTSQLSRQVYDTSEKGFRDALVKMGWMPPGWQVLTDQELLETMREWHVETNVWADHIDFGRAVEQRLMGKNGVKQ